MNTLYFVRHGATEGNLEKRYIGITDQPLCALGKQQVVALQQYDMKPDRLFVSPMRRTIQTAKILFPHMPYDVVSDLKETDFGIFEGLTANELSGNEDYSAWLDSFCRGAIPKGEHPDAFKARCRNAFQLIIKSVEANDTVAFITHGGVIMAILEAYAVPHRAFYDYHIDNGSFLKCKCNAGIINDVFCP